MKKAYELNSFIQSTFKWRCIQHYIVNLEFYFLISFMFFCAYHFRQINDIMMIILMSIHDNRHVYLIIGKLAIGRRGFQIDY